MDETAAPNPCFAAALAYAAQHWAVIPLLGVVDGRCACGEADCHSPAKHPLTLKGLHDASLDKQLITEWWQRWPGANVGVVTGSLSGLVVLDVDGDTGAQSLWELEGDEGPLPQTLCATTGGGGRHLLFRHPGIRVPNSSGKLAPGLDVRGDGGYIVAAPSRHISGGSYAWSDPADLTLIAELPEWLLKRMTDRPQTPAPRRSPRCGSVTLSADRYTRFVYQQVLTELSQATEGTRNDSLNKAAFRLGQFVAAGLLVRSDVETALLDQATALGLGDREAEATVRSGIESGLMEPAVVPEPKQRTRPAPRPGPSAEGNPTSQDGTTDTATVEQDSIPLGARDPASGKLVLSPRRTLPTAQAFVESFYAHPEAHIIRSYAGMLLAWSGSHYREIEDESLRHQLQPWLHDALRYIVNRQTGEPELTDFESNPGTITSALDSIRSYVHLPASTDCPSWLDDRSDRPDATDILPAKSSLIHLPTMQTLKPTPCYFTLNALDYDPDPSAPPPSAWLEFLAQLFDDDLQSWDLLQDWFGYCLTGDTSQQKMLLLVGPKRSGKGTIARVLTRLIGPGNVGGPTTSSLAGAFGLQPLMGKSLAIVSDARFAGENIQTVVERLLCVSGEDTLTIDRKHQTSVTMKLPTRFMFLTNELPRLTDASGALAGRFMMLRLTNSFYGKENKQLTQKLLGELPGILNWAIEGWKRLRQRGQFVQPTSVEDAMRDMEDLASPVGAFVRECCVVGPGHRVWVDDLYNAWRSWCEQDGRSNVTTKQTFGRDLAAAVPGALSRVGTGNVRFYDGIALSVQCPP
jgi:putative DNA primase/helicase